LIQRAHHTPTAVHFKNFQNGLFRNHFFFFFFGVSSSSSSSFSPIQNNFFTHLYAREIAQIHVAANHTVRSKFFHHSDFHFSPSHISDRWLHIQSFAVQKNHFSSSFC
jgi:hypothetical protein